jgi:rhamnulokinase
MSASFVAVDLGASNGRLLSARIDPNSFKITSSVHFDNEPVSRASGLHWNIASMFTSVVEGLRSIAREHSTNGESIAGIGIDSWAIDYGLIGANGDLLGEPFCYRDERTQTATPERFGGSERLYQLNGLQHLPFTTMYQLAAETRNRLDAASKLLLIPDLVTFWLTDHVGCEVTNASTTGLLTTGVWEWSGSMLEQLGIEPDFLPPLVHPGTVVGPMLVSIREQTGIDTRTPVIAVGSHDTASAVVAIPCTSESFAYISCGTWGLVGVELDTPVLTEASRLANFTNELGVDGRVRYLRNVMGLWLLQECVRTWTANGLLVTITTLLEQAALLPGDAWIIDVDDPTLLAPGDMPARIIGICRASGSREPTTPAEITRCIVDSLALAFARTVREAATLSGREVSVVHIVGGGSQNALLCQRTADALELPVVAGPVEATAIGNLLVQARAVGILRGDLETLRALVRESQEVRKYVPRSEVRA